MSTTNRKKITPLPLPRRAAIVEREIHETGIFAKVAANDLDLQNARRDLCLERDICPRCQGTGLIEIGGFSWRDTVTCDQCHGDGGGHEAYQATINELQYGPDHQADYDYASRLEIEAYESYALERLDSCSRELLIGRLVVVARGRKVKHGTRGRIFWIGEDSYGNTRCGLFREDHIDGVTEPIWTALSNCDCVWADEE